MNNVDIKLNSKADKTDAEGEYPSTRTKIQCLEGSEKETLPLSLNLSSRSRSLSPHAEFPIRMETLEIGKNTLFKCGRKWEVSSLGRFQESKWDKSSRIIQVKAE